MVMEPTVTNLTRIPRDVIDTEHCEGDVNKMLLGSFVRKWDLSDEENLSRMSSPTSLQSTPSPEAYKPDSNIHLPHRSRSGF